MGSEMDRRNILTLLAGATLWRISIPEASAQDNDQLYREHIEWLSKILERMQSIKPGMTRERLLTVFTTEGGLSTALHRTYVSRGCQYFKVDVEFEAVGRLSRGADGRTSEIEDSQDSIHTISRPYLQVSGTD
jgi:hypothetical protein